MKLKTLKDLKPYIRGHQNIIFTPRQRKWIRSELNRIRKEDKQEAIKWVKHFRTTPKILNCFYQDKAKAEIFIHFFNITEEDLK